MRSYHWWISGLTPQGKRFLLYGDPQESVCRQKALEMLSRIDFRLKRLPTRDIGKASQMWKGGSLEKSHDITDATRKLGHNKTMKRIQDKRRRIF